MFFVAGTREDLHNLHYYQVAGGLPMRQWSGQQHLLTKLARALQTKHLCLEGLCVWL